MSSKRMPETVGMNVFFDPRPGSSALDDLLDRSGRVGLSGFATSFKDILYRFRVGVGIVNAEQLKGLYCQQGIPGSISLSIGYPDYRT